MSSCATSQYSPDCISCILFARRNRGLGSPARTSECTCWCLYTVSTGRGRHRPGRHCTAYTQQIQVPYVSTGQAEHGVVLSLSSSAPPAHSTHRGVPNLRSAGSHSVPAGHGVHGLLIAVVINLAWNAFVMVPHTCICSCVAHHTLLLSTSRSARPAGRSTRARAVRGASFPVLATRQAVHGVAGLKSLSI